MEDNDFLLFQRYFKEYQQLFGLTGYKVYFKHKPLSSSFAEITINQIDMVAIVILNNKLLAKHRPFMDIRRSAKHEALHLLLGRLENRAKSRYVAEAEIYEAVEELVFKLEDLIKDIK